MNITKMLLTSPDLSLYNKNNSKNIHRNNDSIMQVLIYFFQKMTLIVSIQYYYLLKYKEYVDRNASMVHCKIKILSISIPILHIN
jgi:hypothetical protein